MSFDQNTFKEFYKFNEKLLQINSLIEEVGRFRKSIVDPVDGMIKQKPIWNLECYVQLAIHRVHDLATQSAISWNNKNPSVSFLLTRALYENTAYIYDLRYHIQKSVKNSDYEGMHDVIYNRIIGSRLNENLPKIVNVLTVVSRVAKDIPEFKNYYDFISDFCHPNYSAMHGLYGELDKTKLLFNVNKKYGYNNETLNFIVEGLITGLMIFTSCIDFFINSFAELNEFWNLHQPPFEEDSAL